MSVSKLSRVEHLEVKNKVQFYLSVQRFDAAEKLLKATIAKSGANASLHNLLGATFHRQSRFIDAVQQFSLAIKTNPSFVEAGLNLASTFCDLSRYDDAANVFQKLQSHVSNELGVPQLIVGRLANQHAENGLIYYHAGLAEEAIGELQKALSLFPRMPDVKLLLAKLFIFRGILEKAKSELEDLITFDKKNVTAHTLLGLVHYKTGRRDLARDFWQQAARLDPEDLTSRVLLKASPA